MSQLRLSVRFCTAAFIFVLAVAIFSPASQAGTFVAANASEARLIEAKIKAAHFLSKATFGPTESGIDQLASRIRQVGYRRACEEWIDDQFDMVDNPSSGNFVRSHVETVSQMLSQDGLTNTQTNAYVPRYRNQAWWDIALRSDDQLRQRFAWALSQIFVTAGDSFTNTTADFSGDGTWLGTVRYYDEVLVDNAFGNYRDLLSTMTYSPIMGNYLSHIGNRKANVAGQRFPDENYAREIMQLFSIGLYKLHVDGRPVLTSQGELIPTYDNEDIKSLARLFTGFKNNNTNTNFYGMWNHNQPMLIFPPEHDNNRNYSETPGAPEAKTFLGSTLTTQMPSTLSNTAANVILVKQEVDEGLDVIFNHPNVGPFISRLLIQRMVKSNPTRSYIRRVATTFNDNGSGVKGDFRAVLKAILLDPELSRGQRISRKRLPDRVEVTERGTEFTRLREPLLRVTAMIRALNPTSDSPVGSMMIRYSNSDFGQEPYLSPSVFNFYLPDFQPPGDITDFQPSRLIPSSGLYAPEFQIMDAVVANRATNKFISWLRAGNISNTLYNGNGYTFTNKITFDLADEMAMVATPAGMRDLLQDLDLRLCNGTLNEDSKSIIIGALQTYANASTASDAEVRLEETLIAVLTSPNCMIEE
ncbi:hypothetical protein Poly51_29610 [Rubripirellula tenax]|uniref:DUF1800 domain-containing protein n=1 Tax=Rubripirellula tenax TaxID=2528015 RepID=A0A5C6F8Y2_9BACT|nr:DUF1800 family protein [Rubripirellula tenax]TWU57040.1 hypothetical protein Poly51_29610 [Rubripirellula tenax]